MKSSFCSLLTLVLIVTISCNRENDPSNSRSNYDCEFVENENSADGLLDDTELEMLRSCRAEPFTNESEIAAHLIGEWELVGFGGGSRRIVTQPCGYITISTEELTFEFHSGYLDTISVHQWEIENNWLKVQPPEKHLSLNLFCDQYMIGNYSDVGAQTVDVDQYIYEKVK